MDRGLVESGPVVRAVETGRQVVLLHARLPADVRSFAAVPVAVDADRVEADHADLADEARDRYAADGAVRITTWCRIDGLVEVDGDRLDAVATAGVWTEGEIRARASAAGTLYLSLVAAFRLADPVETVVPEDAERGRMIELDEDVDVTGSEAVLDPGEREDRFGVVKMALGVTA